MVGRAVKEWEGSTPDAKVPAHVRLRIFRRENGICYLSGRKIEAWDKWELEHRIPLSMGGKHAESNLFPALVEPHKEKSKQEAKERAKADAAAKFHLGIKTAPVQKINSAPFAKSERTVKNEKRDRLPLPPRRDIFSREVVK